MKLGIDVRDLEQIGDGVRRAEENFGRIDILVNNAGINCPSASLGVTLELWEEHFNTNVRDPFPQPRLLRTGTHLVVAKEHLDS